MNEESRWLTLALICMAIVLWLLYSINFVRSAKAHDLSRPELAATSTATILTIDFLMTR